MSRIVLSRDNILGAVDIVTEDVPCPEWAPEKYPDGTALTEEEKKACVVVIRNLTGAGRGAFIQASMELKAAQDKQVRIDFEIEQLLVVMTAVDAEGKAIFTREDIQALGARNAAPVSRCATVATRLAGLDKEVKEDAAKKSPTAANSLS